jgi:hypothetical protein
VVLCIRMWCANGRVCLALVLVCRSPASVQQTVSLAGDAATVPVLSTDSTCRATVVGCNEKPR